MQVLLKKLFKIRASVRHCVKRVVRRLIHSVIIEIMLHDVRIFVDPKRVRIAKTAALSNAILNTNFGTIAIGEYTFCGQNVSIITGTHDYSLLGKARKENLPQECQDIVIEDGVWIGSNPVILAPCIIGDNAVIAAGAVVTKDVGRNDIVAGVPAKRIAKVPARERMILPSTKEG